MRWINWHKNLTIQNSVSISNIVLLKKTDCPEIDGLQPIYIENNNVFLLQNVLWNVL